jgi:Raf kinase inhibitor-like YbhB/YbcL family protein
MKKMNWLVWVMTILIMSMALTACGGGTSEEAAPTEPPSSEQVEVEATDTPMEQAEPTSEEPEAVVEAVPFELTSPHFPDGEPIPSAFSCDGQEVSPELNWEGTPADTVSFVLIMDDPDAPGGTWDHWVLFNIPADQNKLSDGIEPQERLDDGSVHGSNSWGQLGYGGPCPPDGTHRYFFQLYALDMMQDLPVGTSKADLLQAIDGHILGEAVLMGTYTR